MVSCHTAVPTRRSAALAVGASATAAGCTLKGNQKPKPYTLEVSGVWGVRVHAKAQAAHRCLAGYRWRGPRDLGRHPP